jgi:hypothetical protein
VSDLDLRDRGRVAKLAAMAENSDDLNRLRVERVLANLEPITQQRDPVLVDRRAVWLEVTFSLSNCKA